MMAGIRSKDTKPELMIRRAIHALGFRYLLHDRRHPGRPDLVFPRYKAVVFVHGCFWHGHGCHLFKWPASRKSFWKSKITGNRKRDARSLKGILTEGWRVLTIWECAIRGRKRRDAATVAKQVAEWLESGDANTELKGVEHGLDN